MPKHTRKNSTPEPSLTVEEQQRLTPLLDCISYLLAKRWLQDQRAAEDSPPETPEHHDKP